MTPEDYGQRLEMVRVACGCHSVRSFHARLLPDERGRRRSYASARNYHSGQTEPPIGYIQQVVFTFDVRVEYLAGFGRIDDPIFRRDNR